MDNNEKEREKEISQQIEAEENKIKIISPGKMVLKRFFRSRLSVIGLVVLIVLFAFSIFGPFFSPWGETDADMRPTPAVSMDFPISYSEKIESNFGIIGLAEKVLNTPGLVDALKEKNASEAEITTVVNAQSKLLLGEAQKNVPKGIVMYTQDGADVFIEVEYDSGAYSFYFVQADENSTSGFSRLTTNIVKRTDDSKSLNLNDVPTFDHWLGTDAGAYDIFTRLMYAGRISLTLGFVVVFISSFIGIFMGGIAGYFGKWADLIIMRLIDIIYCLPSLPIMLIFSAILDGMQIDETIRIYFLMALLSLLGWAGVARTVRGQILALREQEFMVAAEALGISIPRRIAKHLVPNIMPILIVSMTLSLGSTILTEATLSYLGLGIRPPKAAWGTMISSANDPLILQYYPNQWVPAGVMIVLAVLAFNFVGDGLRDAFDPKMKR